MNIIEAFKKCDTITLDGKTWLRASEPHTKFALCVEEIKSDEWQPYKHSLGDQINDLLEEIMEANCDADTPEQQEIEGIISKIRTKLRTELPDNLK